MTNYEKIYWLTRLEYIGDFFSGVLAFLIILTVLHYLVKLIINVIDSDNDFYPTKGILKTKFARVLTFSFIGLITLIKVLLPTRNEALVIMAGGKTMDYIQKDTSLNKLPYQTTELIKSHGCFT